MRYQIPVIAQQINLHAPMNPPSHLHPRATSDGLHLELFSDRLAIKNKASSQFESAKLIFCFVLIEKQSRARMISCQDGSGVEKMCRNKILMSSD